MRKLGLILVLLFTLSIVSGAEFTISGKITPKPGSAALQDDTFTAEFTFSDPAASLYAGTITITNGVFTADFSGMTNAASVVAASDTVTMKITGVTPNQIFSNIPLTTVPKAVYAETAETATYAETAGTATTARALVLTTEKEGNETSNPGLAVTLNNDNNNAGRFWNFRAGGSEIPTVFSYYEHKQLELDRNLATFYGNLNVNGITKLSGKIYQDRDGVEYDVWIQGSTTVTSSSDPDRNLALLGQAVTDTLYVNYQGEYEAGTIIGSLTSPTNIKGDLNVDGVITGDGSGLRGLVGGNAISNVADTDTGAEVTGTLSVTGATTLSTTTLSGPLEVNDATVLNNILRVSGDTTLSGPLQVNNNLGVTRRTTTVSLTSGATTLGATTATSLTSGATTLGATTATSLNIEIPGTFGAGSPGTLEAGATTLSSLIVSGATTLSSLIVSGATTLGATTVSSLIVSGATNLGDTNVAGDFHPQGLTYPKIKVFFTGGNDGTGGTALQIYCSGCTYTGSNVADQPVAGWVASITGTDAFGLQCNTDYPFAISCGWRKAENADEDSVSCTVRDGGSGPDAGNRGWASYSNDCDVNCNWKRAYITCMK